MGWNAPVVRAAGYLISDSDWNDIAYDDMRYLKGLDGAVRIEDLWSAEWFSRMILFVDPGLSQDGFTAWGVGAGTVVSEGVSVLLTTDNHTSDITALVSKLPLYSIIVAGKQLVAEWIIQNLTSIADVGIYLTLSVSAASAGGTTNHFGFLITNADIFATNADGATQKSTDTTSNVATGAQITRLRAVLTPGTNCKFYVNDVLKITHTVNLPAAGDYYPQFWIITTANAVKATTVGRLGIQKEY